MPAVAGRQLHPEVHQRQAAVAADSVVVPHTKTRKNYNMNIHLQTLCFELQTNNFLGFYLWGDLKILITKPTRRTTR